jgi:predicted ATPase/KaiC/GvpD/RAD55 family RecA-like ATPase
MSLDDISEIIKSILEQEDVPAEFCKLIYEKTKGNPFFAEEVVKSLKEEDVIFREGNTWKFKNISNIEFPETVKNVLKTRFSRLDEKCQNVLTMASFVGNDFTLEAMCAVTGIEKGELLKLMDKLFKTGLIKEQVIRGEGICSFADILIRDVVYEEVSPLTRKELHGVVAAALEKVYAKTIDEHSGELAFHFLESGDKDKALDYFLKAGGKATKIYANTEAASYFQSALALLEGKEGEIREKAQVLQSLGDIKSFVGEYDLCLKRWNEALMLWKQLNEMEKVAELHRKMAAILWRDVGNVDQARENFNEALSILEAEPESVQLATVYAARARMAYFTEDVTKTRSWAEKALKLAKKLNASEATAISYEALGLVHGAAGDNKEAVEYMEKALKIALDNGYVDTALRVYTNLAGELHAEENERKLDCYEKGLELAKKAGHIQSIAWSEGMLANMYIGMGNGQEALALAEDSNVLSRKIGNLFNLSAFTMTLGVLYYELGEWTKGEELLKEALSISLRINNSQQIASSCSILGWYYNDRGEYAKAKEYYEKMSETYEKWGHKAGQIYDSQGIAMNCIELGEIDKARTLLDEMHKFALEKQDKQLIANEDPTRAMLLRAEKKYDQSIELFEKSLQENEALDARKWNVYPFARYILCEYARAYLERDQPGDKEAAARLLNQALEIFQKMGAKNDIERVEARIASIATGEAASRLKPLENVSTGNADLDEMLNGGIPSNYAVILTSPSCDERELLVKNFLETGTKKGETVFYVTINPGSTKILAEQYQPNFWLFVCSPQADAIVKNAPNVVKLKGVENLTDISIALASAIRKFDPSLKGPRRICIGLVSDVLLQHHAVETRRWLTALLTKLKSEGFTTLAVMDPGMHSTQDARAILDLFDGEISIFEKGAEQFLKIKRMSNQKYLKDELPLKKE